MTGVRSTDVPPQQARDVLIATCIDPHTYLDLNAFSSALEDGVESSR